MKRDVPMCEFPPHRGDKTKNLGKGMWWMKDPEWVNLCPNCNTKWFMHKMWEASQRPPISRKKIGKRWIALENYEKRRQKND